MHAEFDPAAAESRFLDSLRDVRLDGDTLAPGPEAREAVLDYARLCRAVLPGRSEQVAAPRLQDGGLHYTADAGLAHTPDVRRALVPTPRFDELHLMSSLLARTTLYSDRTHFVVPGLAALRNERASAALVELVARNKLLEPLVQARRCLVLPERLSLAWEYVDSFEGLMVGNYVAAAPMEQTGRPEYSPLNIVRQRRTPEHDALVFKHFLLPYFPQADPQQAARILADETDAFGAFMRWVTERVAALVQAPEEHDLMELLDEIDAGTARLAVEARRVQRATKLRGFEIAFFGVSIAALLVADNAVVAGVAGIAGTADAMQALRHEIDRLQARSEVRSDDFYIPYLLRRC